MNRSSIWIAVCAMLVTACGGDPQEEQSLEVLVEQAARGDASIMAELERRANETAAEIASDAFVVDAETAFQQALYSGEAGAVEALSDTGNAFAQTHLAAAISLQPDINESDMERARGLLEAAASSGHGPALFRIGEDYRASGKIYPLDEPMAFAKGLDAAQVGHVEAMYQTGIRFQYGLLSAPKDPAQAREWLERAKAAGHADAQRQLNELDQSSE